MRNLYLMQTAILVVGTSILTFLYDWRAALSFAIGVGVVFGNVALLAWVWGHLLRKKLVALSLFIIVFKYAILGAILYLILSMPWLSSGWFCVGLGTLMFSAVGAALGTNSDIGESEAPSATGLNS